MCDSTVTAFKSGSHVIPKFFIKQVRDPRSGKLVVLNLKDERHERTQQDGSKGDFLCESCEDKTQRDDLYASLVLTNGSPQSTPAKKIKRIQHNIGSLKVVAWSGLDFNRLRDFVISIALRDHCHRVEKHLERLITDAEYNKLRSIYRTSNSDDKALPIVIIQALKSNNFDPSRTVAFPSKLTQSRGIGFTGVGFCFQLYIGPPNADPSLSIFLDHFNLKANGTINICQLPYEELGVWTLSLPSIQRIAKNDQRTPRKKKG